MKRGSGKECESEARGIEKPFSRGSCYIWILPIRISNMNDFCVELKFLSLRLGYLNEDLKLGHLGSSQFGLGQQSV